jgi:hypothetical protein
MRTQMVGFGNIAGREKLEVMEEAPDSHTPLGRRSLREMQVEMEACCSRSQL